MICLSLTGASLAENMAFIEASRSSIDMVELRADFLTSPKTTGLREFPRRAGLPVLLTLRRREDGGRWSDGEAQRLRLLDSALSDSYAWVDLESGSDSGRIAARARRKGIGIIRSLHDFNGMPPDLTAAAAALPEAPGEVPKLAVTPASTMDLLKILRTMKAVKGPRIILGMGEWGFPTRILARPLGGMLSFVSPSGAATAAPGHLDPDTLAGLYRYHELGAATRIFGVIGNPIMHSLSPAIHNPAYSRQGIDAVYLPFQVDNLSDWFALAEELPVEGFSVTVPHKEAVRRFLLGSDADVAVVGACNTVFRRSVREKGTEKSGWWGANTDVAGFLEPLKDLLSKRFSSAEGSSLRVTVIGAGGAARAVIHGLSGWGARILVLNRTVEHGAALAGEFGCEYGGLNKEGIKRSGEFNDLVVQTTPVGMDPHVDQNPLPDYPWSGREIAYDLIYAPPRTRFLEEAETAGCTVLNGRAMLISQGRAQYRIFCGREP